MEGKNMRLTGKNDQTLLLIVSCFWCLLFVCKHVLTTHPAMNELQALLSFAPFLLGQCCLAAWPIQQPGDLGSSWLPNPKRSKRFRSSSSSLANRRSCVTLPGEVEQREPPKMVDEVEETVSMIGNHTLNVILTYSYYQLIEKTQSACGS